MMSNSTKIWLVIATALVLIGCIIFGYAMTVHKWDFMKLTTAKYVTNHYEIDEEYINILILTDTADILLIPTVSPKGSVVCYEQMNAKHSVAVKDGTLMIEVVDVRKWYEHIGIDFATPQITVYVPQSEYGSFFVKTSTGDVEIPDDLKFESIDISVSTGRVKCMASSSGQIKIKTSTGDIRVENVCAASIDLSVTTGEIFAGTVSCEGDIFVGVSTGRVQLSDTTCKNMISTGSTGDIFLKNVIAAERFSIERSTGDVKFDGCDAADVVVRTDTGNISGILLSEKIFIVDTDTGRVDVPRSSAGGRCEITTDTGDVKITVK